MTKGNSKKLLAQRHISSRMNFLFQASNLMAEGHQSKLAAYYGKLCRNVGTKAVMHIAPALKRSLCRRCSHPLIPGVNTELQVDRKRKEVTLPEAPTSDEVKTKKKRHRRHRKKPKKREEKQIAEEALKSQPEIAEKVSVFLECSLCRNRRSFMADTQNRECWLEQTQSVVQVVSLPRESGQR
ncbi:ribonuclease P protein subunit p21 [Drosophila ficusphila]|uniref:ribonuclease P protein subunit p21 n=1 Tax=Drosophila ficusphila TaxID=30025 RepID=UPI0007E7E4C7|nr:ribonuclease P protein subunit p21 [Drosophila ficusphila]